MSKKYHRETLQCNSSYSWNSFGVSLVTLAELILSSVFSSGHCPMERICFCWHPPACQAQQMVSSPLSMVCVLLLLFFLRGQGEWCLGAKIICDQAQLSCYLYSQTTGHFQSAGSHCVVLFQVWCLCSQRLSEGAVPQVANPMTQCMLLLICPGAPHPALYSPAAHWHLTCLCSAVPRDGEHHRTGSLLTPKPNTAGGKRAPAYGPDQSCFSSPSCKAFWSEASGRHILIGQAEVIVWSFSFP